MTSGATPISLPILVGCQLVGPMAGNAGASALYSRFPMLNYCFCGVDDCSIHVKEEAIKGDLLRRQRVVWE